MYEVYLSHEAEKIYLKANLKTTRLLDHFKNLEESPFFGPNIKRLKDGLEGSFRAGHLQHKTLSPFRDKIPSSSPNRIVILGLSL